ncbi:hypothetical protein ACYOEI_14115, partial [Singulisphaera rosea]
MFRKTCLWIAALVLFPALGARGGEPTKLSPNSDSEPMAEQFSLGRGAQFLDTVSLDWTRRRKCGTCHTNYAHMMAGPMVEKEKSSPELTEVRAFFESRVSGWDGPQKGARPIGDGEIVATATALAFHDRASTGTLHPLTRTALDRMWTVQRADGGWTWFDCDYPPMEDDDYYGIVLGAVAVGHAPGDYKSTVAAQKGIESQPDVDGRESSAGRPRQVPDGETQLRVRFARTP